MGGGQRAGRTRKVRFWEGAARRAGQQGRRTEGCTSASALSAAPGAPPVPACPRRRPPRGRPAAHRPPWKGAPSRGCAAGGGRAAPAASRAARQRRRGSWSAGTADGREAGGHGGADGWARQGRARPDGLPRGRQVHLHLPPLPACPPAVASDNSPAGAREMRLPTWAKSCSACRPVASAAASRSTARSSGRRAEKSCDGGSRAAGAV